MGGMALIDIFLPMSHNPYAAVQRCLPVVQHYR